MVYGRAEIDLFQIIFEQILKIDPSLIAKYTTIQDQLLYLILIPSVILLLFLYGFGRVLSPEHKGLRYLISVVAYVFIIWGGWYGTLLIPLLTGWFYIVLIIGLVFFLGSKIVHPARTRELLETGKAIGEKVTEKGKIRKELEKQEGLLSKQIRELETTMRPSRERDYMIGQLKLRLKEIQHELEEL